MTAALGFLVGSALLLVAIYCLHALGLIEDRTRSILYGLVLIAAGLGFLVFCILLFAYSGETLAFSRNGKVTNSAEESVLTHLLAWVVVGAITWKLVESGWNFLTEGHDED